jgi:hypothetical protein
MEVCIMNLPKVMDSPTVQFARLLNEYRTLVYTFYEEDNVYNKCHTDLEKREVVLA